MRTRLLFYKTENSEVDEKIVRNALAKYGLTLGGSVSAYSPIELMRALSSAVEISEMIFIVGGLELPGRDNTIRVLSQALGIYAEEAGRSRSEFIIDEIHMMKQPTLEGSEVIHSRLEGAAGTALDSGTQCIICLPDQAAQLSDMLEGGAAEHFSARYGLTEVSFREVERNGLIGENTLEKSLDLSSFGDSYNNEAVYEPEKIRIHGKKDRSVWPIIRKALICTAAAAVVLTVFLVGCHAYSEKSSDYIAKSPLSQTRSV